MIPNAKAGDPLKIAFITGENLNSRSGVNNHAIDYYRWFKRRGHNAKIAGPYDGNLNLEGRVNEEDVIKTGDWIRPVHSGGADNNINPASWRYLPRMMQLIDNYDVLQMNNPGTPGFQPWMLLALSLIPKQTVNFSTFHASGEDDWKNSLWSRFLRVSGGKKVAIKSLDRLFAVSRPAEEYAQRHFPGVYSMLPNPVDTERFTPGEQKEHVYGRKIFDADKFNLLFVGRNDPRKGLRYLAKAYLDLHNDPAYRNRVRLIVGGPGEVDDASRHFLSQIPNENEQNYVLYGDIPASRLPDFYRGADVAVFPAVSNESWGIVLLEAAASGTPVIASNIEGYAAIADGNPGATYRTSQSHFRRLDHELLKGKGIILSRPQDAGHLAGAVRLLMDSPDLAGNLRAEGLANSSEFSPDKQGLRLEKIYYDYLEMAFGRR